MKNVLLAFSRLENATDAIQDHADGCVPGCFSTAVFSANPVTFDADSVKASTTVAPTDMNTTTVLSEFPTASAEPAIEAWTDGLLQRGPPRGVKRHL